MKATNTLVAIMIVLLVGAYFLPSCAGLLVICALFIGFFAFLAAAGHVNDRSPR